MYYNETIRKIIFLFIYIDSFFIYTIYSRIYLQFIYLSFDHNQIIISQYIIIKQNHHIIFKQNHHIIIIKQNHHYHTNIIIICYKIITEEFILLKKKLSLIIGSKTHPDPLCTNQFSIGNC